MSRLAGILVVLAATVAGTQQSPRDTPLIPTKGTAALSGVVVNDEEPSQPVRRAIVMLAGDGLRPRRGSITDDEGRFAFSDLPAGQFTITVSRASFITSMFGAKRPGRPGTPIAVADGARVTDIVVKLWRGAAVAGTLRDDKGTPVPGIEVRAVPAKSPGGLPSLTNNGVLTDEQGQFRIFGLEAGAYVVTARPSSGGQAAYLAMTDAETDAAFEALRRRTTDQTAAAPTPTAPPPPPAQPPFDYAPIYYPGSSTLTGAATITLAPGQTQDGLDFALQRVATTLVEGTVVRPDGTPAGGATLQLTMRNAPGPFGGNEPLELGATAAPDGSFRIAQVRPGDYELVARAPVDPRAPGVRPGYIEPPSTAQFFAVTQLTATGADMRGLTLSLAPGTSIRGRVIFDSDKLKPPTSLAIRLSLIPESYLPLSSARPVAVAYSLKLPPFPTVAPDGTFEFAGVAPGRYQLRVDATGLESWQLRSAVTDGRDVLDGLVDVTSRNPMSMVVTYDDRSTRLSGRLETSSGSPASDVFVLAFATDRSAWGPYSRRVMAVRPGRDGTFEMTGLPAGEYFLAALDDADPDDWLNAAFLDQVVPAALKITLTAGTPVTQNLRIAR